MLAKHCKECGKTYTADACPECENKTKSPGAIKEFRYPAPQTPHKCKSGEQLQHSLSDAEFHRLNKPAGTQMAKDCEVQTESVAQRAWREMQEEGKPCELHDQDKYQIKKQTTIYYYVGIIKDRVFEIVARFNDESTAREYCTLQEEIDWLKAELKKRDHLLE